MTPMGGRRRSIRIVRHRARGGKLAAQLVEVGVLAADPDRHRHGDRQQAGILGAEEGVEEARPGVGGDQQALARREAGADQAAGHDVGALADLAPRQGGQPLGRETFDMLPALEAAWRLGLRHVE